MDLIELKRKLDTIETRLSKIQEQLRSAQENLRLLRLVLTDELGEPDLPSDHDFYTLEDQLLNEAKSYE